MPRISLKRDVRPITEFRARTAAFLEQVARTRRPLVLTQKGRSRAVLLDVDSYERLAYEREMFAAIARGEKEVREGKGIDHEDAMRRLLDRYRGR